MDIDNLSLGEEDYVVEIKKRVYYAETDAGRIVYYGNLCKYIEMGCAEWFRKFSSSMKELHERYHIFFVMKEVNLNYKKPVCYDDEIIIRTRLKRIKYFSIKFITEIYVRGEMCYYGENKMIPVDIDTKKPVKIPDDVLQIFDVA